MNNYFTHDSNARNADIAAAFFDVIFCQFKMIHYICSAKTSLLNQ